MRDISRYTPVFGCMVFSVNAPDLCRACLSTRDGWVQEALERLNYGCVTESRLFTGSALIPSREIVMFTLYLRVIDHVWSSNGLRLTAAWLHLVSLPQRIAELDERVRASPLALTLCRKRQRSRAGGAAQRSSRHAPLMKRSGDGCSGKIRESRTRLPLPVRTRLQCAKKSGEAQKWVALCAGVC